MKLAVIQDKVSNFLQYQILTDREKDKSQRGCFVLTAGTDKYNYKDKRVNPLQNDK